MIELAKSRSSKSRANLADWLATHDPGLFLKRATVIKVRWAHMILHVLY